MPAKPDDDNVKRKIVCKRSYFVAQRNVAAMTVPTIATATRISIEPPPLSGEKPKWRSIKVMGPLWRRSAETRSAEPTTPMVAKQTATSALSIVHLVPTSHKGAWLKRKSVASEA